MEEAGRQPARAMQSIGRKGNDCQQWGLGHQPGEGEGLTAIRGNGKVLAVGASARRRD